MILSILWRFVRTYAQHYIPFSLSGLIATGINYAALYIFFGTLGVLASATLAFALGTLANFFLQKFWTFADRRMEELPRQFALYLLAALILLAINDGVFYAFTSLGGINYVFAQIAATAAVSIVGVIATQRIFAPAL